MIADGRKYVSALVQLEFDTVGKWAESRRIAFTHFRSLAEHPQVRALVEQEIARANQPRAGGADQALPPADQGTGS